MKERRPLIVHVVYSFHTGGLENGIVNLVNRLPVTRFRHAIVALTNCSREFCQRIVHDDVQFIEMNKPPGHALAIYPALYRLFKELKPAVVHTRNLAALEAVVPAMAAGVSVRIHGEHGWDVSDPRGESRKYRIMRRLYRPFVNHYVALSAHLESYLLDAVGIPRTRLSRICNGVDTARFHPAENKRELLSGSPFNESRLQVVGTVGRLQTIKGQINLVHAFAQLLERMPHKAKLLRLMIAGDGPLRGQIQAELVRLGIEDKVWLAGDRNDIAQVMRAMDVFVLPSLAEGISNTILEAMASGLPVVATDIGGNSELVDPGRTGLLVAAADPTALSTAIGRYVEHPELMREHGCAARSRAENEFSIVRMVQQYEALYRAQLERVGVDADAQYKSDRATP